MEELLETSKNGQREVPKGFEDCNETPIRTQGQSVKPLSDTNPDFRSTSGKSALRIENVIQQMDRSHGEQRSEVVQKIINQVRQELDEERKTRPSIDLSKYRQTILPREGAY